MPKNLVNLDALLVREDFEELKTDPEPPPPKLPASFRLNDIVGGITSTTLRKPDFQRETTYWTPRTVAEFVQSFVEGDVIPSIILWRSPTTGNIFVIDGAHRFSALIAWVKNDYGDGPGTRAFFENKVPLEQEEAATKTRNLIKKLVGSYDDLQAAASHPENTKDQVKVIRARNADLFEIPLLWVVGNAKKAEESFYRINSKAVAIDQTELRMIKARKLPSALVARAIIRGGVGHEYWSAFPEDTRTEIKDLAKTTHDILFIPPMPKSPLNTLDLPIAGRSYSGGDSLGLIFDFVSLVNNLVPPKGKEKEAKHKETEDADGTQTIAYLKNVKRVAQRLSGKHPSSVGLHPAVYFYGITGRYQPTAFLATIGLIQLLEETDGFRWFTDHRAAFEEFLLKYRYFTNQIVSQFGGRLKSYDALLSYYKTVLEQIGKGGKGQEDIAQSLQGSHEFRYLKERDKEVSTRADFSNAIKTVTYVREAIEKAIRCKICDARISPRSISYDHIQRREDGGMGDPENTQMTHPYCNSTYKN